GTTAQVVVRYLPNHSQSNSMNLVSYTNAPVCRTEVEKAPRPGGMLRLAAVGLRRAVAGGKTVLPGSGQGREQELDLALGRVGGGRTVDDGGRDVDTVGAADGRVSWAARTGSVAPAREPNGSIARLPSTSMATSGPPVMNSTSDEKNGFSTCSS